MDQKLLDVIKAVICKGGDIYKEISSGSPIINYCTRLDLNEQIKMFQNSERHKDRVDKKVVFHFVHKN